MKISKYIYSFVGALTLLLTVTACSPDDYSLGSKDITSDDLAEGKGFTIEHDSSNPNIVYLKSTLGSNYQVLWDEPQGRGKGSTMTLKIPFAGEYQARMGVETRGGVVYGPYATFTVSNFCADFVTDQLWTMLSGGVGKSKKWYLDIDKSATCRYFVGPLYFYSTDYTWNNVMLGEKATASGSWTWLADWKGNTWMFGSTGAMDYGYMQFDLNGGANVTVQDNAANKTYKGTYMLDTDNHTMKLTDAVVLHDPGRDGVVLQWNNITLLALDDNHMQLAVLRDNSTEGKCLLSYNFISEDYRNNWTPSAATTTVVPSLQSDWQEYVEPKTQNTVTYKLAEDDTPYDWCNLDGTEKNITSTTAVSGIGDLTLVMNHSKKTYTVTAPDGTSTTGTYTLSSDGIYTFSAGMPIVQLSTNGQALFKTNADNSLRIMAIGIDGETNGLKDLWLGSQNVDDQGNLYQYMGYHFAVQQAGQTVKKYTACLYNSDNVSYNFVNSDNVYVTADGDYTCTISGSNTNGNKKILYLQIDKILKDHPNADIIIKDIKVDGNSIAFDDATIVRTVDDNKNGGAYNGRRYIYNPWSGDVSLKGTDLDFNKSLSITFHVTFDSGSVVLK